VIRARREPFPGNFRGGTHSVDASQRPSTFDERASVTGVTIRQGDGALAVEIKHARDSDTGGLRMGPSPVKFTCFRPALGR
jgi:hypothetical protein